LKFQLVDGFVLPLSLIIGFKIKYKPIKNDRQLFIFKINLAFFWMP